MIKKKKKESLQTTALENGNDIIQPCAITLKRSPDMGISRKAA